MIRCLMLLVGSFFLSSHALAKPVQPQDDDVLARVSTQSSAREQLKLRQLRMMLNRDAKNLGAASELGSHFLALGQRTGKPEYYGMAESAIAAWSSEKDAPPDIKLIRSAVHRFEHEFSQGLADLDSFIAEDSTRTDVLMTRSILHGVMGNLFASEADCQRMTSLKAEELASLCQAQLKFFMGQFSTTLSLLQPFISGTNGPLAVWATELYASAQLHLGLAKESVEHLLPLNEAGALSPSGLFTLVDAFIDLKQWGSADDLLAKQPESIATLAKRAVIEKRSNPSSKEGIWSQKMTETIATMTEVDRKKHARELAYFYLLAIEDAPTADQYAQVNYAFQKEPIDARLAIQAADEVVRKKHVAALKETGIDSTYAERSF